MGLIDDEQAQLDRVERTLLSEFGDRVSKETICAEVATAMGDFDGAPIRTYVPILLQKRVMDKLRGRVIQLPD